MTDEEPTTQELYIVYIKYHELKSTYVSEAQILISGDTVDDAIYDAQELFRERRKGFMTHHKVLQSYGKRVQLPTIIRM